MALTQSSKYTNPWLGHQPWSLTGHQPLNVYIFLSISSNCWSILTSLELPGWHFNYSLSYWKLGPVEWVPFAIESRAISYHEGHVESKSQLQQMMLAIHIQLVKLCCECEVWSEWVRHQLKINNGPKIWVYSWHHFDEVMGWVTAVYFHITLNMMRKRSEIAE